MTNKRCWKCGWVRERGAKLDDLVSWLRAQLDEEHEAATVADALTRPPWVAHVQQDANGRNVTDSVQDGDDYAVVHVSDGTPERAVAEHIARWDPARVLAEVDAKRRILDELDKDQPYAPDYWTGLEVAIGLLALPYAGHPATTSTPSTRRALPNWSRLGTRH
jgi:hypothetical protein